MPEPLARPLTAKQARFVSEYLVDLNATQAAIRAGYSGKTARAVGAENLTKPDIAAEIAAALDARSARTEITQDYVLTAAREVLERCMQRVPVLVQAGDSVAQATDEDCQGVWKFDAKNAIGALNLLGKHLGMGGPAVTLNIDFDSLNDAQLAHIANGGALDKLPR